jgi:hypothetical protein
METRIYHCDNCKKQTETNGDLFSVDIVLKGARERYNYDGYSKQFDYCDECMVKLGFAKKVNDKMEVTTIEDLIRGIVEEELDNR